MRKAAAALALLAAVAGSAAAGTKVIVLDEHGAGGLRLGRTLAAIKADGLIGKATPGCERASPRPVVASLKAPLRGAATFTKSGGKFRLRALSVRAGAITDRGIRIGSTAAAVKRAYPTAKALDQTDPLLIHALVFKRRGVDKIWFMLTKHGGRVTSFELPAAQACE